MPVLWGILVIGFALRAQPSFVPPSTVYAYVRIAGEVAPQLLWDMGADDHAMRWTPSGVETVLPAWGVDSLRSRGVAVEVLIPDMEDFAAERLRLSSEPPRTASDPRSFRFGSMGGFYRLEEIYEEFARMQQFFPQAVAGPDTLGFSVEGRPLLGYRFSLGHRPDTLPAVLYTALHHAREPGSVTVLVYFLWWLLEQAAAGHPEARALLQQRLLYVVPVVNPDGYAFNESRRPNGGGMWRKNRRPNPDGSFGVDLNRNYGPLAFWDAPNNGSSLNPQAETYRGPAPFSEPELQAIRALCQRYRFRLALHYHTYSNLLIYPFSALERETPDSLLYRLFAAVATRENLYSAGRDLQTVGYAARGVSDDWFYDTTDGGKPKVLAMTPEVGTIVDGFWPPRERLLPQARENLWLNRQAAWSAGANIRPLFFGAQWESTPSFWLQCCNIGTAPSSPATVSIQPLSDGVSPPEEFTLSLPSLGPAECRRLLWALPPQASWREGDSLRLEVLITHDGVTHRDTCALRWGRPSILPLFVSAEDAHRWELDGWGVVYDSALMAWTLSSAPAGTYRDSASLYATLRAPLLLPAGSSAVLDFWARWSVEANYDVATLEISTDGGASWQRLRADRMKQGLGLPGSRQEAGLWGWDGHFPLWHPQRCDVSPFAGQSIRLRIGLLSDPALHFAGISVAQLRLLTFQPRQPSSVSTRQERVPLQLFPQPIKPGQTLYLQLPEPLDGPCTLELTSVLGQSSLRSLLHIAGGIGALTIPPHISAGAYQLVLRHGNRQWHRACLVLP